jgi:eukaryotic translation initiation factor 2C
VGVDVSHPEPGSTRESIAAVVGSMNRSASQYAACISAQASREEEVSDLTTLMVELFEAFKKNNGGQMPAHVIVYRDGVSTGQFDAVRWREVPAVKEAVELLGYPADTVKITYLICSKGHKCRFGYRSNSGGDLINGCPGLCINEQSGLTSTVWNEFYIQHHAAIQGTAKTTRYSLLYDEIGLTGEQLEVLTHWICHLYSRCNMAVSKATPAAYAHLAALRARKLLQAGATPQDLRKISRTWSQREDASLPSSMNFI